MDLYHTDSYQIKLNELNYPELSTLNFLFYKRFINNKPNKYNKEWTVFDTLFSKGLNPSNNNIPTFDTTVIDELYGQLIGLNRAPNSYPFNNTSYSRYLIVTSLGGDIDNNTIPDNRTGAFYMLTPENYNTNEIYERMSRELNNGILYPESADVLFRYRSRIVLDLASESNFSFGGNINIYEINNILNLPKNRINTNLFYIAFLIGKYFDTDRFFRQFPITNKLIPYDSTNVYTWVPQNIAMMIAHRRDIRSNLRLPVHELLKLEDNKDASYINRIKSGQINNEHMEEILLYFTIMGNDVEALSFMNIMDLQKILKLYVKLPQLEPNKNRLNVTETVDVNEYLDNDSEELYNILKQNIKPDISNENSTKVLDQYINGIIGYPILVDYETYKELLNTDYSILRSLYILKGCPTKRALLTYPIDTVIGLITGQIYPIKDYQDRLYLTNRIKLLSRRNFTNVISLNNNTKKEDKRIYHDYAQIANIHPNILKGNINVNTNNVDSLARLYGISLEYLNYYNINAADLPDQKVRHFNNIIRTMNTYFNRPLDNPKLSVNNVKTVNYERYNDFELLELFNLHPINERKHMLNTYDLIRYIPTLPIILNTETHDTFHLLDTRTLTIREEPIAYFTNTINDINATLEILEEGWYYEEFDSLAEKYTQYRNELLFGNNRI